MGIWKQPTDDRHRGLGGGEFNDCRGVQINYTQDCKASRVRALWDKHRGEIWFGEKELVPEL